MALRKAVRRIIPPSDPFDPGTWTEDRHEHRIYGDDMAQIYAIVDDVDYWHFSRWRWYATKECRVNRRKVYMCRRPSEFNGGVRIGVRSVYLHVEIMKRTGIKPPSAAHKLVDHRNGDGLDCRRSNLRWATRSMNNTNLRGSHSKTRDMLEAVHEQV